MTFKRTYVSCGSRGVANWTRPSDPVLLPRQKFNSHSYFAIYFAAIPLGKGLTVCYLVFLETVSVPTQHCTHVKSHLTLRKREGPGG